MTSYYFTLFKKLRIIGSGGHTAGTPSGGLNLDNPGAIFGSSTRGALLGASTVPADSPIWAVLNAGATGGQAPTINGVTWPRMPLGVPAVVPPPPVWWTDFQIAPATNKLVDKLGGWITAGKVNDTPAGVIARMPPPALLAPAPETAVTLFAASSATDNGVRPEPCPGNSGIMARSSSSIR